MENPYKAPTNQKGFNRNQATAYAAFNKGVQATIVWMDEPCTEHCLEKRGMTDLRYPFTYFWYAEHRRDCPKCWQSIKEVIKP